MAGGGPGTARISPLLMLKVLEGSSSHCEREAHCHLFLCPKAQNWRVGHQVLTQLEESKITPHLGQKCTLGLELQLQKGISTKKATPQVSGTQCLRTVDQDNATVN